VGKKTSAFVVAVRRLGRLSLAGGCSGSKYREASALGGEPGIESKDSYTGGEEHVSYGQLPGKKRVALTRKKRSDSLVRESIVKEREDISKSAKPNRVGLLPSSCIRRARLWEGDLEFSKKTIKREGQSEGLALRSGT